MSYYFYRGRIPISTGGNTFHSHREKKEKDKENESKKENPIKQDGSSKNETTAVETVDSNSSSQSNISHHLNSGFFAISFGLLFTIAMITILSFFYDTYS